VIGDYSFETPLLPGSRIALLDMAHYSIVKNTTFNGIPLPRIMGCRENHELYTIKEFGYEYFKERLS
jgi:carboxynorspermidine decarboxylase